MSEETNERRGKGKIVRREFLAGAGLVMGSVAAGSQKVARPAAKTTQAKVPPEYEVVSPQGASTVKMITMAPRLDTLEGKTICLVSNGMFKHEVTFPVIADLLKKRFPTAKVIPYTELPISHSPTSLNSKQTTTLIAALKEKGCDAVIGGNGG